MIIAKKLINIRYELFKFQIVKNEPPNHFFTYLTLISMIINGKPH